MAKPKAQKTMTEKCRQRNRVLARKGEVNGIPILFRQVGEGPALAQPASETAGYIPRDPEECLAMIHALQPEGATPVTTDDVYLHVIEAANNNFIPDRFMFLGESTLRNIAAGGAAGASFMNSHRTGDLSQPSELPFGQTFAGQFFALGVGPARRCAAQLGVFLRRGVQPNGAQGPSTDDLHRMIEAGALRDVSVGLYQGRPVCDVCGNDYYDSACGHYAGTTEDMTEAEMTAQADRGVPDGCCSITLEDAVLGEVSAVFDGAVPAAGVRKILARGKSAFSRGHWEEAVRAFGPVLLDDSSPDEVPLGLLDRLSDAVRDGVTAALAAQTEADEPAKQGEHSMATKNEPGAAPAGAEAPDATALQAELADLRAAQEAANQLAARQAEELAALREQNDRLEAERRNARFAAIVNGADGNGKPWVGDFNKHVAMLESLARAFGEDAGEFGWYVEQNRVNAAVADTSSVFAEKGRDAQPALFTGDIDAEVTARVTALQQQEPSLSRAQAETRVFTADPALYARHRQAHS